MSWNPKTSEEKIHELERKISELYGKIGELQKRIGFDKQSWNNNLVSRLEKLEKVTGDPFSLFNYPMESRLRALKELVGEDGEQHVGEETRYNITLFRILVELTGMRSHLAALQYHAERESRPDGLDESNMKGKETKMYQLKHLLLSALGVVSLGTILEINELCWRSYNTPVMEPASIIAGDMKLKDRGTKKLVEDIDKMIEKLGKEIDFKKYVKYFENDKSQAKS